MNVLAKREGFVEEPPEKKQQRQPPPSPPPEIEPAPSELAPLAQDLWPITVKLIYKPIRNNAGVEVKELTLREPRAGDLNRHGLPIRVNQEGDILIDERKMSYMIAALSNILVPLIENMDPRDWAACAYRLRRFFLPDPEAW